MWGRLKDVLAAMSDPPPPQPLPPMRLDQEALYGHRGERVGEAGHPGPAEGTRCFSGGNTGHFARECFAVMNRRASKDPGKGSKSNAQIPIQ